MNEDVDELDELYDDDDIIDTEEDETSESIENKSDDDEGSDDDDKSEDEYKNKADEDGAKTDDESDDEENDEEIDLEELDKYATGIDNVLSSFGIEGGVIEFEDGTRTPFNELDGKAQTTVLDSLIQTKINTEISKFSLSDDEISVLNLGRESDKTMTEVIEELASQRAQVLYSQRQTDSTDYESMEKDAVFLKYLQENNPESTPEEVEKALADSKALPYYEKFVETVRQDYKDKQLGEQRVIDMQQKEKEVAIIEQEREEIVNTSLEIDSILGIPINDDTRNEVLSEILEVNEYGDSLFMEKVFSDPRELFKVAWLAKYGEEQAITKDDYWKRKVSAAYKKGKSDALVGAPAAPVSYNKNKSKKENKSNDSLYKTPLQGGGNGDLNELYYD